MSKITESARGEMCQIRLPGCTHNPETVVFCHASGSAAGKGIGMKAPDILGAYGCASCHDHVDYRKNPPAGWTRDDVKLAFAEAIFRTQRMLLEKGLLEIA